MMIESLIGRDITLFFWDGETRHEVHGRLRLSLGGYVSVTTGVVEIHFRPESVKRVGSTNNIWLEVD
jgi:hypothetical protein